jgi:hypothetical protein
MSARIKLMLLTYLLEYKAPFLILLELLILKKPLE